MRPEDGTPPVRLRTELRKESKLLSPAIPRQTSERGVIVSKNGLPRKPLTRRRLKNLILNVLKNPFNMVVLVSLIILFCLIIIPLLTMISNTFTLAQGELRRVQGGLPGAKLVIADCGLTEEARGLADYLAEREDNAAVEDGGDLRLE